MDAAQSGQAIVEGTVLGLYDFDRFKSSKDGGKSVETVEIVEFDASKLADAAAGRGPRDVCRRRRWRSVATW